MNCYTDGAAMFEARYGSLSQMMISLIEDHVYVLDVFLQRS